jgi:hypothetical protein
MANSIPNNGRAVMMRNRRTGAAWLVSFDYRDGSYWHEPQGNLRPPPAIRFTQYRAEPGTSRDALTAHIAHEFN